MADPFGENITAHSAELADKQSPIFQDLKLGQRLRQLRVDEDVLNNKQLTVGPAISLASGGVSHAYTAGNALLAVTGHASNELTITDAPIGCMLVVTEAGTAVVKLKIGAGSALTLTSAKTTTLLVTSATTAVVIAQSP